MTKVRYKITEERHELAISGHAGYANAGEDIVCAGVSAIGYALLGFLRNEREAKGLSTLVEGGNLLICASGGERVAAAFEMAYIGLAQISKTYPQYVDCHIFAIGDDSRERPQ